MEPMGVDPKEFDIIYVYLRSQAIADGVLRDISKEARKEGFKTPVAVTAGVWNEVVAWDDVNGPTQDEPGRLADVVLMAKRAILTNRQRVHRLGFKVYRVPNTPCADEPEVVELAMERGSGDDGEIVLTIMLSSED